MAEGRCTEAFKGNQVFKRNVPLATRKLKCYRFVINKSV